MSLIVKIGKKGKAIAKRVLSPVETHHISYTRRIERVKTDRRILAMTFDDGPMDLPCSPDLFDGRSLSDVILDTLEEFGAKGTFDVIGDTSDNYPDKAGAPGSAAWGGIRYDHYPDFGKDASGGAVHNDRLIRRMLGGGHQITNHGYRHIIFGKKPFVYGKRVFLGSFDGALEDLTRLHRVLSENYGYEMTMGRPPHYVDRVQGGLSSYDVYDVMGYQYLAASFDGAGWLPSTAGDRQTAFEEEVRAMAEPVRAALEKDPDFFCGQIIFQKEGCNMARRTPVAVGLRRQLEILSDYGYRVVTVNELMKESPFTDVGRDDPDFEKFETLQRSRAVVFSDNRLRPDAPMKTGELAMLLCPKKRLLESRRKAADDKKATLYRCAVEICAEEGLIPAGVREDAAVSALPEGLFDSTEDMTRRSVLRAYRADR
ncbi:MAG: polysaccharide deacetylase family protein [Oscillospiraceae bacterium]|nr:polysaccharide deacetylase family protein [Oscillospiraceae bacterium]